MVEIIFTYVLCFILRVVEYFGLHTDRTIIGEAVIHKILGIVIMIAVAKKLAYSAEDIGFTKGKSRWNILKGVAFGISAFIPAYVVEVLITMNAGSFKALDVFVSTYAIDKNLGNRTAAVFFLICILGNVINVVMEEGMFRGLFARILSQKHTFLATAVITSVFFGMWHIVGPVRNYIEGTSSLTGMVVNSIILVASSTLVGLKFTMLTSMTGSLYFAMGDHFVNNTIVNLLHVITGSGADEMMVVRVSIAQTISFLVVLACYIKVRRDNAAEHASQAGFGESRGNLGIQ